MAHTKQAKKRIRQNEQTNEKNRAERSRLRNVVKKTEVTLAASEDKAGIAAAFKNAMAELHKAARKGLVKKGTASRKISRLAARIRAAN